MSYQSIKRSPAAENTPTKWMLTGASVLAVATFIVFQSLVWTAPQPVQESPRKRPVVASTRPLAGVRDEAPRMDINVASLSDSREIPPPILPIQLNPSEGAKAPLPDRVELSPQALSSPDKIKATVSQLNITAVTDNKAIINGLLFEAGDFIDKGKQLRFMHRDGGTLIFEVKGTPYSYKIQ
jgi:hypothetical protein